MSIKKDGSRDPIQDDDWSRGDAANPTLDRPYVKSDPRAFKYRKYLDTLDTLKQKGVDEATALELLKLDELTMHLWRLNDTLEELVGFLRSKSAGFE